MFFLIKSLFWIAVVYTCVVRSGEPSAQPLPSLVKDIADMVQGYAVDKGAAACTANATTCLLLAKRAADMTAPENEPKLAQPKGDPDRVATGVAAQVLPPERPRTKVLHAGKTTATEDMRPSGSPVAQKRPVQGKSSE